MKLVRIISDPYCPDTKPCYPNGIVGLIKRFFNRPTHNIPVFFKVETENEIQIIMSPRNAEKCKK